MVIRKVDVVFIQFGGYWSLIPTLIGRIFNKKILIVLHGTDCASIPSLNYGNLRKKPLKAFCLLSYKYASILLPVSSSLVKTKNTYFDELHSNQGYKSFCSNINTPHYVISNGLDTSFWHNNTNGQKEKKSFVAVLSPSQIILKGADLILQLSKKRPDYKFYIAGVNTQDFNEDTPKNFVVLGHLSPIELRKIYQNCEFHFQLSIYEGFGIALCEAMLCGCIPITSSVNALPQIINKSGFIVYKRKIEHLIQVVDKAVILKNINLKRVQAKEHIKTNYSIQEREFKLLKIINKA